MSAPLPSPEEQAVIDRFEAAKPAPEAHDPAIWAALSDLIPCPEFGDCGDECECVEGELRLAIERLIMAERLHRADCEGDACCVALERRVRVVNQAAAIAPVVTR